MVIGPVLGMVISLRGEGYGINGGVGDDEEGINGAGPGMGLGWCPPPRPRSPVFCLCHPRRMVKY